MSLQLDGSSGLSEIDTSNFPPKPALESSPKLEALERLEFTEVSWWLFQTIFYLDTQYFHMFIDILSHLFRFFVS